MSLLCRQTNIIWIGFVLATSIIREINLLGHDRLAGVGKGAKKRGSQLYDPLLGQSRLSEYRITSSFARANKLMLIRVRVRSQSRSHALLDHLPHSSSRSNNLYYRSRSLPSPLRWFRFLPSTERRITRFRYVGSISHDFDDQETDVAASLMYRR